MHYYIRLITIHALCNKKSVKYMFSYLFVRNFHRLLNLDQILEPRFQVTLKDMNLDPGARCGME